MLPHFERHRSGRTGWLRAAVLGADDGLVSTAALLVGVAASGATRNAILTAGVAALSAGAMAMAIGEYVSVSAQPTPRPRIDVAKRLNSQRIRSRNCPN